MQTPVVKFNRKQQPEFFKELRLRVNNYFKENNITQYANSKMKFKTVVMFTLYLAPLVLMLTGVVTGFWPVLVMWVIMGFGKTGIGTSIMHDANHGSYSQNKYVNNFLGYAANLVGAYHVTWKIQHNVLHHSYTNIHDHDEDISNPLMRLSPNQDRKWLHKFQIIYAPFFYGIMTLYWTFTKDIMQVLRYHKMNLLVTQKRNLANALTELTFNKVAYIIIFLVLPIWLIDLPWWQVSIGFVTMHFFTGLALALIFQTAHVVQETEFFETSDIGSVENNWAIHQLLTTSNFSSKQKNMLSWFIGGLDYQIEHHLFPNICHIHYRKISKIVRETAQEFGIPYFQHKSFLYALKSHFALLHQLGTGKYDQQMA